MQFTWKMTEDEWKRMIDEYKNHKDNWNNVYGKIFQYTFLRREW